MNLDQILDKVHRDYPHLVSCVIEKKTMVFFNADGLPQMTVVVNGVSQDLRGNILVNADIHDYRNKLTEGKGK